MLYCIDNVACDAKMIRVLHQIYSYVSFMFFKIYIKFDDRIKYNF